MESPEPCTTAACGGIKRMSTKTGRRETALRDAFLFLEIFKNISPERRLSLTNHIPVFRGLNSVFPLDTYHVFCYYIHP
jgi:hypothetical protein